MKMEGSGNLNNKPEGGILKKVGKGAVTLASLVSTLAPAIGRNNPQNLEDASAHTISINAENANDDGVLAEDTFDASSMFQTNNTQESQEAKKLENPRLEKMPDHDLPAGFQRQHVYAEVEGKKTNIASVFYFESGKTEANFISNDKHPECFSPTVNYQKISEVLKKQNKDLVIAFAGAYRSPSGNIEGVAYENGVSVGEDKHAAYGGMVYIDSTGKVELLCTKDANNNFDETAFAKIEQQAKDEKGSFYQQKTGIWHGQQKLFPKSQNLYEMRAICKSKDGKLFVLNCTEKITQEEFLKMCMNLKDENGQPAVYDLMLEDTGECSSAAFRTKTMITWDEANAKFSKNTMVDEGYAQKGFTNATTISVPHK